MSSFRDVWDFESLNLSEIWDKIEQDPERILIGAIEPFSTELWNVITGNNYEPMINQLGGPMGSGWAGLSESSGVYDSARAKGIDTQFSEQSHDVAEIIAVIFGTYGLGGIGGAAAGAAGGAAGGAGAGAGAGATGAGGLGSVTSGVAGVASGGGATSAATLSPVVVSGSSGVGGGVAAGVGGAAVGGGLALDASGGLVAEGTPGSTPLNSGNQAYATGATGGGGGNFLSNLSQGLQGFGGSGGGGDGGGGGYQNQPIQAQRQITPIAPTNPNVNSRPMRGLGAIPMQTQQIDPQLLAAIKRQLRPASGWYV